MDKQDTHIVRSFSQDLAVLEKLVAKMGGLAEAQFANAMDALHRQESRLSAKVVAEDHKVDAIEEEINHLALRILALRHPHADDLRAVITALKVASTLERIGDYAKNIAKRTTALCEMPRVTPSVAPIVRMGKMVQSMIKSVLDAYLTRDAEKAVEVRSSDEEVDHMHTSLFRELLTYMMEDARNIGACSHLLFVAKNIERIGDHATLIAEQTLFLVEGHLPDSERPKDDSASYTVMEPEKTPPKVR